MRDNGPGFPAKVVDKLFEPYMTTKQKGTGLGLAIVKKIVEEHGGRIAAGNHPQGGASVVVNLPVQSRARTDAQQTATRTDGTVRNTA